MRLGWIDFSKEERNKVLSVIDLLSEEGTLDELGIAPIRDGFADLFFPGTSTIQTRAKYFFIVPYALAELSRSGITAPRTFLEKLDTLENECGKILTETNVEGVIGRRAIKSGAWVKRTPADIYWAGIRRYGIFTGGTISLSEYTRATCTMNSKKTTEKRLGNRKDDAEEFESDDVDAGGSYASSFWCLPHFIPKQWMNGLTIELTLTEASFLKRQIIETQKDTMMACILNMGNPALTELGGFQDLADGAINGFPKQIQSDYWMAMGFSDFIYVARTRYNVILSKGLNKVANSKWEILAGQLDKLADIDIDAVFLRLGIFNPKLKKFLEGLKTAMLNSNIVALDECIKNREINIKGPSRAKLNRAGEFPADSWIGGGELDYRFRNAAVIIRDIFNGEKAKVC